MRSLVLALVLAAGPAAATGLEIEVAGEGANGTVRIDLLEEVAPNHVARITELARSGAYDDVVFHRVIDGFMAQTGDVEFGGMGGDMTRAGMGGSSMPDLAAEFSAEPFERGTIGMARAADPGPCTITVLAGEQATARWSGRNVTSCRSGPWVA